MQKYTIEMIAFTTESTKRESFMGRNIFLRGQRTGIIVTLLSISSGAGNAEGRKTEKRIELGAEEEEETEEEEGEAAVSL